MKPLLRLVCACLLFATTVARAQSNLVLLISQPDEYITQGKTYYTTNTADFAANLYTGPLPAAVQIYAFGLIMNFAGPNGAAPSIGTYTNATKYPLHGSSPGMSVTGNGRGCDFISGSFRVLELQTVGSTLTRLWVTFSQNCNNRSPLTGEIRFNSALAPPPPIPRILRVPTDFATIQSALDNTSMLTVDEVLVDPGLYEESVQFGGKRARLISAGGPTATYIMASGGVAIAIGGAPQEALVSGFTLMDSVTGITVSSGGSPTIVSNAIVNCGTGINCGGGSPTIRSNTIKDCSGPAVILVDTGAPLLDGNRFESNGGGIGMDEAGSPEIRNNVIRGNRGDGMWMQNYCDANIAQNLIFENSGDGIKWLVPLGDAHQKPWVVNNTIVGNGGAGISADGFDGAARIINNIVIGNPGLWVGSFNDTTPPIIQSNNIYSSTGLAYSGLITNLTGTAGNISANPLFTCQPTGDFHLLAGSPCIDAGANGAPLLTTTDFDGHPRIQAGSTNGPAAVDLGAFEFDPSIPPADCRYLFCPSNMVVVAPAGQASAIVTYPDPVAAPGALVTSLPPSGSSFPPGDNTVSVTAVYGTNVLNCSFTISVFRQDDFASALGTTNAAWSTSGDAAWFVQTSVTRQGFVAVQSGAITNNQTSTLQMTVLGPGLLSFWWKVSSELGHDVLSGKANGATQAAISGQVDWQQQVMYLGSGSQSVEFVFAKDASGSAGQDAGWLDLVACNPGGTAPIITTQPSSSSTSIGRDTTFSVAAVGTPPLIYQWQFNGTNLSGATNALLTLSNVQYADVGNYRVVLTNVAGSATSAVAAFTIYEVIAWGSYVSGQTNVPLNLTNVIAVAGGWHHSVALRADGTVAAWGANNVGQTKVPANLSNVVAISSRSGDHSMALRADGTVVLGGTIRPLKPMCLPG